jgi:phosphoglycerate dehydrogenase-like enzyme
MKTIVLTDSFSLEDSLKSILEAKWYTVISDNSLTQDQKKTTIAIITYVWDSITSAYLQQYPSCKYVLTASTWVNHIDHAYCTAHGITIFSAAWVNSSSVAEFAVCMMISLLRHIPEHITDTKLGIWNQRLWNNIAGKTIWFVWCGNIAQQIAWKLIWFSIWSFIGYDPYGKQSVLDSYNIHLQSLQEVCEQSDIICMQLPSTDETYHLLNDAVFRLIKKNPYLINIWRGDTLCTTALINALQNNIIAWVACDVFEWEPTINETLRTFPNVILTPHIASKTVETKFQLAHAVIEKLLSQ